MKLPTKLGALNCFMRGANVFIEMFIERWEVWEMRNALQFGAAVDGWADGWADRPTVRLTPHNS